ncbi:hypothetical protein F4604DRAFT_1880033 [Suillus subluteus]|nr:hypothetical protein F4604DRAFT_1880033 [Suillus subluteus]
MKYLMSWTSLDSTPGRCIFFRPLGIIETTFYWAGVLNNTADVVMHMHLRTTQASDQDIHSQSNVMRAWASVKRRFPLIAAEVEEHELGPRFIIREETVMNLRPDDVTFMEVNSFHHVECFVNDIMDGPRRLSSQLLTHKSDHFHVVVVIAHCITDVAGTSTVLRTFFDTLSSRIEPPCIPLGERVHMYQAFESNLGSKDLPLVKQRWRRALGYAIGLAWMRAKALRQGGHTLPGDFRESTPRTSPKNRNHVSIFSRAVSSTILTNCHRLGISMNSAYYALSQVAMARVLCRRYLRGQISEEEWEYRKRQPMYILGPINLRPYQDKDWFETGGSGDVGLGVGLVRYMLPFMPLGEMSRGDPSRLELVDGAPDFPALMSFDRFLLRCANVKAQGQKLLEHPRLADICTSTLRLYWAAFGKEVTLKMRDIVHPEDGDKSVSVQSLNPIYTQVGATLGNMDNLVPIDYPLPPEHYLSPLNSTPHAHRAGYPPWSPQATAFEDSKTPRLHVEYWRVHNHTPPAELYLGASTVRQQLQYFASYDQHVFSDKIVAEWLSELKDATLWYLGQPHGNETPLQSKL